MEISERFEVLNDGPNRWVLIDKESDDPAPVFETKEQADRAMIVSGIEAMGGVRSDAFDEETGRPVTRYTIDLTKVT